MTSLTRTDLAEKLHSDLGLNKREAMDLVEDFFAEIKDTLAEGQHVKLSGFGNFVLRDKPERPGRNPKTGEDVTISARRVVTFKASHKLKTCVESPNQQNLPRLTITTDQLNSTPEIQ